MGWLLVAIGRLDQPHPRPARPTGPMAITIPSTGVKAGIVGVGLRADGAMQLPPADQVGWYKRGPRPGAPGPAVLIGHVDDRTGPAVFYRLRQLRPRQPVPAPDQPARAPICRSAATHAHRAPARAGRRAGQMAARGALVAPGPPGAMLGPRLARRGGRTTGLEGIGRAVP
jgi:Sortase domain